MSDTYYKVVFSGQVISGKQKEVVKQALASLYKKDIAWAEQLFNGKTVTIKTTDNLKDAVKYVRAFKQCGAEAEIARETSKASEKIQPEAANNHHDEMTKGEQIHNAFNGEIKPLKPDLSYRISIVLVAISMALLPLFYLATAAAVGYGCYRFSISTDIIETLRHGSWMGIIAYFGIIAGGIATILFMLKPIFSQFGGEPPRFALNQMQQKSFISLVEQIAEKVGAPTPSEIVIDGQLNASASLIDGALRSRALRLTVGLPLIRVCNANQLCGVIAHELGHFSQTTGMGMTMLIWRINHWFYLAASGQDPWDYKLERLHERASADDLSEQEFVNQVASIFFTIVMVCLWLSRKVIAIFWKLGELISASISRQMEFDADRYETHLVGSQVFEETSLRIAVAGVAYQRGMHAFDYVLNSDNQLVDDLSKLTQLALQQVTGEEIKKIHRAELNQTTGVLDSHPATKDRIAKSKQENREGIFQLQKESTWLFEGFDALSEKYTLWHYRHVMETRVDRSQLIGAESLFEKDQQTTKEWDAMREHPLASLPDFFSIPLQKYQIQEAVTTSSSQNQLSSERDSNLQLIEQLETQAKLAKKGFERAEERMLNLKCALFLVHAGITFHAKSYRLRDCDEGTIQQALEKAELALEEARVVLNNYAEAHIKDILLTRQLLHITSKDDSQFDELTAMLEALATLEKKKGELNTIWDNSRILSSFAEYFDNDDYRAALVHQAEKIYHDSGKRLQRIFQQLGQATFPFEYGGANKRTLADATFPESPSFNHDDHIWEHMNNVPQNYFALRGRVLGRTLQIRANLTAI